MFVSSLTVFWTGNTLQVCNLLGFIRAHVLVCWFFFPGYDLISVCQLSPLASDVTRKALWLSSALV